MLNEQYKLFLNVKVQTEAFLLLGGDGCEHGLSLVEDVLKLVDILEDGRADFAEEDLCNQRVPVGDEGE